MSSGGNTARRVGYIASNQAMASRRALESAARSLAGRTGMMFAALSSSARMREASSRNARARTFGFKCAVARYDWIATRISTRSTDGAGRPANASVILGCIRNPTTRHPPNHPAPNKLDHATGSCAVIMGATYGDGGNIKKQVSMGGR